MEAAQPFAERLGRWVGPMSGFVLCLAGGYWVAKSSVEQRVAHGVTVGIAGAVIDLAIAGLLGAGLPLLLIVSNLGRVFGGTTGGWLASRTRVSAA